METNLNKYIIIDIANHKVGIIGYLTPKTKVEARENNVEYIDEIIAIREQVKELKSQGVNILIALGHSGYIKDVEIAKEVEGLDLVIGGHTNTFLWNGTAPDSEVPVGPYPTYVTQASGRKVPVVQAYAYTKYLGRLHIVFNYKEEVIHIDGNPILLDKTIPQDPQVLAIIDRYRHNVNNIADRYVGNTSVVLSSQCKVECNLGNLITDAMVYRYAFDHVGEYWTDASIAILQKGGIRSSIAHSTMPADVTEGDLLTVMPFVGNLVVVTMNGNTLRQMLEHSVADHKYLPGKFLQYSGIRVEYDLKRANMSRVVTAKALCANCKIPMYEKIQDDNTYKVIMPNFVYNGGDGFSMFKGLPVVTLEYSELEATQFYIRHHSPIFTAVEGRIVLNDIEDDKDSAFHLYPSKVLMLSTLLLTVLISMINYKP